MRIRLRYLFFVLALPVLLCRAQDDGDDGGSDKVTVRPSRFSIRSEFSVPTALNPAWRKCMVGVVEGNASLNMKVAHDFFAGVGYKFSLFYTPPKFFVFELKTRQQMHNVYLKLGYDIYKTNRYFITPAINTGWCFTKYTGVICKKEPLTWKPEYQSWFIEPQVAFNFLPDPDFGICFHMSYVLVNHVWNPEFICMQDHISLGDVKRNGITSYINFGFGIYCGFGKGRTIAGK